MSGDWRTGQLGDFFEIVTGGTPSKAKKEMYGSYMPLVKPPELTGTGVQSSEDCLSEEGAAASRILPIGSVLVSCIGNLGKTGISRVELATNQQINSIKPNADKALPAFVFYLVQAPHFSDQLNKLASGTTVPIVNKSKFKSILIALPPLLEQKRIVAILDEAFAGIDTAIANTERNLANARELFESYLNSVFSQRGEDWVEKPLANYFGTVSTGPFGSLLHKSDYVSHGVPLVNPINIVGEQISPEEKKMIGDDTKRRLLAYILKENDIVIARRGEIGRCAVVTQRQHGWVCGTGCFFIRPTKEVNPHFLAHLLRSATYRVELVRRASGATMLNLSNKTLSNLEIAMPCLEEQNRILEQVSELKAKCQDVQAIYQQKLTALTELKQSLLQKAFSGELTADPADAMATVEAASA